MNEHTDPLTEANHRLITQMATYYNDAKKDVEFYKEFNSPTLETLRREHLMHWKKELHTLIFDGMNCSERCA